MENTEYIYTVSDLIKALRKMPKNARVCGSKSNGRGRHDREVKRFLISHHDDGTVDGLVYVGIDYKHPN